MTGLDPAQIEQIAKAAFSQSQEAQEKQDEEARGALKKQSLWFGGGGASLALSLLWITNSHGDKLDGLTEAVGQMTLQIDRNTRVQDEVDELKREFDRRHADLHRLLNAHVEKPGHDGMTTLERLLDQRVELLEKEVRKLTDGE